MTFENYSFAEGRSSSKRGALIELVVEVKELMGHGWQPLGAPIYCGTQTAMGMTDYVFFQAIVKPACIAT